MNYCDITLWVEILATLTSDQRLDENKIFTSKERFSKIHPVGFDPTFRFQVTAIEDLIPYIAGLVTFTYGSELYRKSGNVRG